MRYCDRCDDLRYLEVEAFVEILMQMFPHPRWKLRLAVLSNISYHSGLVSAFDVMDFASHILNGISTLSLALNTMVGWSCIFVNEIFEQASAKFQVTYSVWDVCKRDCVHPPVVSP